MSKKYISYSNIHERYKVSRKVISNWLSKGKTDKNGQGLILSDKHKERKRILDIPENHKVIENLVAEEFGVTPKVENLRVNNQESILLRSDDFLGSEISMQDQILFVKHLLNKRVPLKYNLLLDKKGIYESVFKPHKSKDRFYNLFKLFLILENQIEECAKTKQIENPKADQRVINFFDIDSRTPDFMIEFLKELIKHNHGQKGNQKNIDYILKRLNNYFYTGFTNIYTKNFKNLDEKIKQVLNSENEEKDLKNENKFLLNFKFNKGKRTSYSKILTDKKEPNFDFKNKNFLDIGKPLDNTGEGGDAVSSFLKVTNIEETDMSRYVLLISKAEHGYLSDIDVNIFLYTDKKEYFSCLDYDEKATLMKSLKSSLGENDFVIAEHEIFNENNFNSKAGAIKKLLQDNNQRTKEKRFFNLLFQKIGLENINFKINSNNSNNLFQVLNTSNGGKCFQIYGEVEHSSVTKKFKLEDEEIIHKKTGSHVGTELKVDFKLGDRFLVLRYAPATLQELIKVYNKADLQILSMVFDPDPKSSSVFILSRPRLPEERVTMGF